MLLGFLWCSQTRAQKPPRCRRRCLKATQRRTLGWLSQKPPQGPRVCHKNLPRCKLHALYSLSVIPPLLARTSVKALSVESIAQNKFCRVRWCLSRAQGFLVQNLPREQVPWERNTAKEVESCLNESSAWLFFFVLARGFNAISSSRKGTIAKRGKYIVL